MRTKPMRLPMLLIALPFLAGCPAHSTRLAAIDTRPATIPGSLKQSCQQVADLPDRPLSSAEAARLWADDRRSLGECRRRHHALVIATEAQAAGL